MPCLRSGGRGELSATLKRGVLSDRPPATAWLDRDKLLGRIVAAYLSSLAAGSVLCLHRPCRPSRFDPSNSRRARGVLGAEAFTRGRTGASAVAVVGTGLLVGIRRARRGVHLDGVGLFGLPLARLLIYDIEFPARSRASSFLAVGAMLLAAGFTHQPLSTTT
jgi:uncharacterized membrane protein